MIKISKKRKVALASFLCSMGLLMFHPLGRVGVMFFIPMGVNAVELFGFACFIAVLVIITYPWMKARFMRLFAKRQKKQNASADYLPTTDDRIYKFMYNLAMRDTANELTPYFRRVINIGVKRKRQGLVVNFLDYYGELTLKFLQSKEDLSRHNVSLHIEKAISDISQGLSSIKTICDSFTARLLDDDLMDLRADITVLGQVSASDDLL